jgi:hypothetical protein
MKSTSGERTARARGSPLPKTQRLSRAPSAATGPLTGVSFRLVRRRPLFGLVLRAGLLDVNHSLMRHSFERAYVRYRRSGAPIPDQLTLSDDGSGNASIYGERTVVRAPRATTYLGPACVALRVWRGPDVETVTGAHHGGSIPGTLAAEGEKHV